MFVHKLFVPKLKAALGGVTLGPALSQCLRLIRVLLYCFLVPVVSEYLLIVC